MLTTLKLLELVKKSAGNCSDYRASKLLGINRRTPSSWIHRGSVMDDETVVKAAEIAGIDVQYALACIAAERAKGKEIFATWKQLAHRLDPEHIALAAAIFAVIFLANPFIPGIA